MNDDFYKSLEDRFYAARDVIRTLRMQYLPIIDPLRKLFPGAAVFDVGCGRGEWLELMLEAGFAPQGMDLDEGMLLSCVELGLPAKRGDAVAHLGSLADESHALVTAFHVVEHVSFEQLRSLVANALRVLKPGGLLIMEVPNPENLVVATHNFYLDPTHRRPLPAPLLAFIAEQTGFFRVTTLRLQESARMREGKTPSLYEVLAGVSPDFAVVAQKGGLAPEYTVEFDAAFACLRGVGLADLAERYDAGVAARIEAAARELADRLEAQQRQIRDLGDAVAAQVANKVKTQVETAMGEIVARLESRKHGIGDLGATHYARLAAVQAERDALRASWSWRVTAPLRWLARPFMEPAPRAHSPSPAGVPAPLRPLVTVMKRVLRDPQGSYHLNQRLMGYPRLHGWLVELSKRAGIYPGVVPPSDLELTAAARRVYQDLLDARAARKVR